jgi:Na+(H+)/acetate symporter ActP
MLGLWISMNSSLLIHGIAAVCLSFLLVIATDYYTGLILPTNKVLLMVLVFVKMGFMAAITFMQLSVVWYLLMAVVLLFLCVVFRKRAQKDFLRANLSVRAS